MRIRESVSDYGLIAVEQLDIFLSYIYVGTIMIFTPLLVVLLSGLLFFAILFSISMYGILLAVSPEKAERLAERIASKIASKVKRRINRRTNLLSKCST